MFVAFVDICATDRSNSISLITRHAVAVSGSDGVDAGGHLVAAAFLNRAFVDVGATKLSDALADESGETMARTRS